MASGRKITENLDKFVFAGNATFTLRRVDTGARITYKVKQAKNPDDTPKDLYFVSYLRGPNNDCWQDYEYMGIVSGGEFRTTAKTRVTDDAPSLKGWRWLFPRLNQPLDNRLEFWHEGRCGRCGRKLTVPESIESGFGPECIGKI